MRELLRSNDPVLLSWVQAVLAGADIDVVTLDAHTSVLEGSISAVPRRIMVGDEYFLVARRVLADAGHVFCDDR